MITNTLHRKENSGTNLQSVGDYEYELSSHGTHTWEHDNTNLTVEMRKKAGVQDGYGRIEKGFTALARDASGEAVDDILHVEDGYLPTKADAWKVVRKWMVNRPEGELLGDEEVRY